MLNFTWHSPTKVYFGKNKINMLEGELHKRSKKILLVYGKESIKKYGIYNDVLQQITKSKIPHIELSGIQTNPILSKVYEGIKLCKDNSIDFILAVGGGSVIDTSKAIAAGVKYNGDIWDYFQSHKGPSESLPIGTVLTHAATGSEMNGNSVITNEKTKDKLSCSSPVLIPCFSILNPEYTYSVDPKNTAAGIADIMSHVFEYYLSPIPQAYIQDRLAEALLMTCLKYGPIACKNPNNYEARSNLMWSSTLALNGLIGKGKISDWTCHAIEHEISGLYNISHGIGLAILLPNFMKVSINNETVNNFALCGINVFNINKNKEQFEIAEDIINKIRIFFNSLGLPSTLTEIGITDKHFQKITKNAIKRRGKVGHYKQLTKENIMNILNISL